MNDDEIVLEEIAHAIFADHLLKDLLFDAGEIDFAALQRVMHLFRDREKISCALDDAPLGAQTEAVHEQGERRNGLRHPPRSRWN